MAVFKMMDLSTGHLSHDTFVKLEFNVIPRKARHNYGILVHVPNKDEEGWKAYPEDLKACFELALKEDAILIDFDQDGDIVDELPFYDW